MMISTTAISVTCCRRSSYASSVKRQRVRAKPALVRMLAHNWCTTSMAPRTCPLGRAIAAGEPWDGSSHATAAMLFCRLFFTACAAPRTRHVGSGPPRVGRSRAPALALQEQRRRLRHRGPRRVPAGLSSQPATSAWRSPPPRTTREAAAGQSMPIGMSGRNPNDLLDRRSCPALMDLQLNMVFAVKHCLTSGACSCRPDSHARLPS
jgi:hypothetical protein